MKVCRSIALPFGVLFTTSNCSLAQTWVQTAVQVTNSSGVAISADGRKIFACNNSARVLYVSFDFGSNWTTNSEPTTNNDLPLSCFACSADGTTLLAGDNNTGGIFASEKSGANWTSVYYGDSFWQSACCSADGMILAICPLLHVSTNFGASWLNQARFGNPRCAVLPANGSRMVIAADQIYWTTNLGASWASNGMVLPWQAVATSADGTKMAAAAFTNSIYTSSDSGATWIQQTNSPSLNWMALASSADGMKLVAIAYSAGPIYSSADGGVTWTSNNAPLKWWSTVVSSADGSKLAAASISAGGTSGGIWVSSPRRRRH